MLIALYCAGRYLLVDSLRFEANDFSPIYVAAHLVADGKAAALYDHHPYLFNIVPLGEFTETAARCGFKGTITPYVHLPLFAVLSQLLLYIPFSATSIALILVNILSVVLSLYLILKITHTTFNLRWFCIAMVALAFYYPLRYGLRLGQTSPLVFLGIISLYYLDKSNYPKLSGFILGWIISLKITPLLFLLYFLIKKRWSVAISGIVTTAAICSGSILFMGWESNVAFFNNLVRLNGLSVASWNNQSIDGFLLRWQTGALHVFDWHLLPVTVITGISKYLLLCSVFLLWFYTLARPNRRRSEDHAILDFSLILVISIMFSPIAWTHYLLFFMLPYIVLVYQLTHNKKTPYRTWLIGGTIISYVGMALPPSYLLSLLNYPLLDQVSLNLLSSAGLLGGLLLLIIILIEILAQ